MKNKLPKMKTLETNHKLNLQTEPIICKLIMKMTSEQILKPKKGFLFWKTEQKLIIIYYKIHWDWKCVNICLALVWQNDFFWLSKTLKTVVMICFVVCFSWHFLLSQKLFTEYFHDQFFVSRLFFNSGSLLSLIFLLILWHGYLTFRYILISKRLWIIGRSKEGRKESTSATIKSF